MKVTTLLENTACREELAHPHGLSLYIESGRRRILFDMGPDNGFLDNAAALGVDLDAVDTAVLSHGHYDHAGGLAAFLERNAHAKVYVHKEAFGDYYAVEPGEEPEYIGVSEAVRAQKNRFVLTGELTELGGGLTLFSDVGDGFQAMAASAKLKEKTAEGFRPDAFRHEQDLLVREGDKAVLFAGCAHRGIVNILRRAEELLGRKPDAVFAGFHLFALTPDDPDSDALIEATGKALLEGETVYYTGHCTGDYAYERLHEILGNRLRHMTGGGTVNL